MFIVKNRKIFFGIATVLVGFSLYAIFAYGFNLGIDFRGGTLTEVRYALERPEKESVEAAVASLELGGFSVRPSGDSGYAIRTRELVQEDQAALYGALSSTGEFSIERSNTVGPVAGAELRSKSLKAIAVVIVIIVLFVTFAFRKVSYPVSSWKYGLSTVVGLFHDLVIPAGIFAFLGRFYGVEIDLLLVGGLLAILGYSVHNTIVVFDRLRENLRVNQEMNRTEEFEATAGRSVSQTLARSVNTSLTLVFVLVALMLVGSGVTRDFALLLIIGAVAGTYSSVCLASPFLVTMWKIQDKKS